MGITQSNLQKDQQRYTLHNELLHFLTDGKTSIKYLPEATKRTTNKFKMKVKSETLKNINTKVIEDTSLELFSEILEKNNHPNITLYNPLTTLKLTDNYSNDFMKYQNENLNEMVKNFALSNNIKLNEIEEHVSSIKTHTNIDNSSGMKLKRSQSQTKSEDKTKNDDQLTVNSLLKQMTGKKTPPQTTKNSNYKNSSGIAKGINQHHGISLVSLPRNNSSSYINMTSKGKSIKRTTSINPKLHQQNEQFLFHSNYNQYNNMLGKESYSGSRDNTHGLHNNTDIFMNNANSEIRFNKFVNKAMLKLKALPEDEYLNEGTHSNKKSAKKNVNDNKNKRNVVVNVPKKKYDFHIEIIKKNKHNVLDTENSNDNNNNKCKRNNKKQEKNVCKKYFKLKKEIEEEEIIKKFQKQTLKTNNSCRYKIHIDLRKIEPSFLEEEKNEQNEQNANSNNNNQEKKVVKMITFSPND
jgi:hypothetical protein